MQIARTSYVKTSVISIFVCLSSVPDRAPHQSPTVAIALFRIEFQFVKKFSFESDLEIQRVNNISRHNWHAMRFVVVAIISLHTSMARISYVYVQNKHWIAATWPFRQTAFMRFANWELFLYSFCLWQRHTATDTRSAHVVSLSFLFCIFNIHMNSLLTECHTNVGSEELTRIRVEKISNLLPSVFSVYFLYTLCLSQLPFHCIYVVTLFSCSLTHTQPHYTHTHGERGERSHRHVRTKVNGIYFILDETNVFEIKEEQQQHHQQ